MLGVAAARPLTAELTWPALLAAAGAAAAAATLLPWARWITPDSSLRRFDACFFVAPLPAGQQPRWLGGEADRSSWFAVRAAVAAHDAGEFPMLPPTMWRRCAPSRCTTRVASVLASGPDRIAVEDG